MSSQVIPYHPHPTFWWQPIDIASLVMFRFFFAGLGVADMIGTLVYKHWMKGHFDPEKFQFRFIGFEWLPTFSDPWMSLLLILIIAAGVGVALGWYYRFCALIWALGFSYTFLLEKAYYLNHGYFYCLLCWIMIILPAQANYSLDILAGRTKLREEIPRWCITILCFMMGLVYFYGGIAKLNPDWLQAMPLKIWLQQKSDLPVFGLLFKQETTAWFMSYGGLIFDLSIVFLLLFRRTRLLGLSLAIFFHLTNTLIFKIGIFPWLSLLMTLLFFPPDLPRHIWAWLIRKIPIFIRVENWWINRKEKATPLIQAPLTSYAAGRETWIMSFLVVFCSLQLLIPLRHHYFPGDVAWTEEGHRFSWRMMLRSKSGYGSFRVVNQRTGETRVVRPGKLLSKRQAQKLFTHPDMILQFAHYLRDEALRESGDTVQIYADIKVKLNGKKYYAFIDKDVDLAREEWSYFNSARWILEK